MTDEIRSELFRLRDEGYRAFQIKLIPTVAQERVIGVRTPQLRQYAKELIKSGDVTAFLRDLPHDCFDEDQLHAFLISENRDFDTCIDEVERFLPFVDNWATCDQLSPKVLRVHKPELLPHIRAWLRSKHPYTVRFGIGMLMQHYLDEDFDIAFLESVAALHTDEYYVNMMIAWYFATALAKQYPLTIPFLEERKLDKWTHDRAIQKALESRRIPPERKAYLRSLKTRG